jgi:hypothetical protein
VRGVVAGGVAAGQYDVDEVKAALPRLRQQRVEYESGVRLPHADKQPEHRRYQVLRPDCSSTYCSCDPALSWADHSKKILKEIG